MLFHERLKIAADLVSDPPSSKTYIYYQVLQRLALLQDGDRDSAEKAYRAAIEFDPEYEYFYKLIGVQLMPRWGGVPGDWEAFAQ